LLQRVVRLDVGALTASDVLTMATLEGARALGLDGLIGSLEPGKRADIIRLSGDRPGLANVQSPPAGRLLRAGSRRGRRLGGRGPPRR
jgi:cytosine/adenosine deaminase-related metal-dependent hydrolase